MKPKKSMQEVSFRTVEEFLEYLPLQERRITEALRALVLDTVPGVQEKLSYNVPFYRRHRNLCFIWPASVLWGTKKSYSGVRFGFSAGYLLRDEMNYLDKGDRKQVYMKDFQSLSETDFVMLRMLLLDACEVDDLFMLKKSGSGC